MSFGLIKTEFYAPDDGREAKFAKHRHAISHRWIAFAGVGLVTVVSLLFRVPVRQAITALPLLTALMVMFVLRNQGIEGRRGRSQSIALAKKVEDLEWAIHSVAHVKSPWAGRLMVRRRQLASDVHAGAKWDVRPRP